MPTLTLRVLGFRPDAGSRKDGASKGEESAERFSADGAVSAAARQRERDFSDLRDRKRVVVRRLDESLCALYIT